MFAMISDNAQHDLFHVIRFISPQIVRQVSILHPSRRCFSGRYFTDSIDIDASGKPRVWEFFIYSSPELFIIVILWGAICRDQNPRLDKIPYISRYAYTPYLVMTTTRYVSLLLLCVPVRLIG